MLFIPPLTLLYWHHQAKRMSVASRVGTSGSNGMSSLCSMMHDAEEDELLEHGGEL
jgi:hypothetical protein